PSINIADSAITCVVVILIAA
ncbi:signal peptidase II, partial [Francisella tularensis subsp. holarctica]|nr:signal peptidase II [Francisella tularensis subsp. holarctica]